MLTSTPHEDFRWLLERELLDRVPKTHYALVASSDGMARYFCGLTKDQADGLAAMATPLLSVVAAMAQNGGRRQTVHQVMAELDDVIFYVCAAGLNGVLAVAADPIRGARPLGAQDARVGHEGASPTRNPTPNA